GGDRDGGEIHLRQRRHGQQRVGHAAEEKQRDHQQDGRHGPGDEGGGEVHGAALLSTWAMTTRAPGANRYWPELTTCVPGAAPPSSTAVPPPIRRNCTG